MKKFLKILGAAALVAGFAPYRFEVDEETGTQKVQALLWSATRSPGNDGKLAFDFGPQPPFKKEAEEEEAHLFSDELTVDYSVREDSDSETAEKEDEAPAEKEEVSGEPESPEETETAAEPKDPEADEEA